jgi:hypothetical protein
MAGCDSEARQWMDLKALRHGVRLAIGMLTMCLAGAAGAQESLDQGKSPAQLFASDCAICHKSPQGLARAGGILGLDSFLRAHYTASRETATAIANYLKSMDSGPAGPGRAAKRTAKGDAKAGEKTKPGSKPTEDKPEAKTAEPKSAEPKPTETKPAEILAPEPKSASPASEAKPAEGGKSEKSE